MYVYYMHVEGMTVNEMTAALMSIVAITVGEMSIDKRMSTNKMTANH
jgi:hypothetical protein